MVSTNTLLSQAFILENAFHRGNSEESVHSKDREEGKEPLIAWSSLVPASWLSHSLQDFLQQ